MADLARNLRRNLRRELAGALAALTAAVLVLAPRAVSACAVCFSGRSDETRVAFIVSTAAMTLLPVGLGVGGFLWLRRRLRAEDEAQEAHRTPESAPGAAARS